METVLSGARPANPLRRVLAALEPWYDFDPGGIDSVKDDVAGDGRFFSIDWFGLHLTVFDGRTPKREG
jgi:hypothetical protein